MTESLNDIRKEIERQRDRAMYEVKRAQNEVDCMVAALEAHDRAVAAMNGAAQPAPARKERRDIAALVLDALTDQPQTAAQIAHAIGVQPSRVTAALIRVGQPTSNGWVRSDD
jgi:hypothetical protein